MLDHRPFASLGSFNNSWLQARYHFSFSRYWDPARTGHGPLIVWNDDEVAPHSGFAPHSHDNMEIITYIRNGAISHEDHLGNSGRIATGEVQVMSAGSGITHAEHNRESVATRLFQIWIKPAVENIAPRWEERAFDQEPARGAWQILASGLTGPGHDEALRIHQEAAIERSFVDAGQSLDLVLEEGRGAYLVLARGALEATTPAGAKVTLDARDGLAISDETQITLKALENSELVVAKLPLS